MLPNERWKLAPHSPLEMTAKDTNYTNGHDRDTNYTNCHELDGI